MPDQTAPSSSRTTAGSARATIVFVHGLWLTGYESAWLRRELKHKLDADAVSFSYRSVAQGVEENAAELAQFLGEIRSPEIHLVGHSLGGLVILKYFAALPALAPGRVVLLGPPLNGSESARRVAQFPWGRWILGRGILEDVVPTIDRHWNGCRDLGIIAGDLAVGLGRMLGPMDSPNDGTVLVEETRLEGAKDHIVLPVSHTGMQFSNAVAEQAALFLREGRFEHR